MAPARLRHAVAHDRVSVVDVLLGVRERAYLVAELFSFSDATAPWRVLTRVGEHAHPSSCPCREARQPGRRGSRSSSADAMTHVDPRILDVGWEVAALRRRRGVGVPTQEAPARVGRGG
jgi:hypothetical protein